MSSLINTLRLLRIFDAEPVLIAALVKNALLVESATDVSTLLEGPQVSDGSLKALQETLLLAHPSDAEERILLAERAATLPRHGEWLAPGSSGESLGGVLLQLFSRPSTRHDGVVALLRHRAELLEAARQPWPAKIEALRAVRATGTMSGLVLPSTVQALVGQAQGLAVSRCAAVAVAVERYRAQHGRPPDALAALEHAHVPALPADPLTGRDLLYSRDPNGYVVYSVGENGRDDGGQLGGVGHASLDWGIRVRDVTSGRPESPDSGPARPASAKASR